MIERVRALYPNASVFATTLGRYSAPQPRRGAILLAEEQWRVEPLREIQILDRIAAATRLSAAFCTRSSWAGRPRTAEIRWATGALATASVQDYATPADEEQVWSIYHGNARVKR
jgi:2-dehydro-3-deoxygluconokinase